MHSDFLETNLLTREMTARASSFKKKQKENLYSKKPSRILTKTCFFSVMKGKRKPVFWPKSAPKMHQNTKFRSCAWGIVFIGYEVHAKRSGVSSEPKKLAPVHTNQKPRLWFAYYMKSEWTENLQNTDESKCSGFTQALFWKGLWLSWLVLRFLGRNKHPSKM